MFWRERERDGDQNGGPPCGQVRVLVVGDAGVGKTSLVHLILKGSSIARPSQTVGCTVGVKHISYGSASSSSNSIKGDAQRDFFVELWDVSGHERYKDCRSLFYTQINGVIFVHDLTQRRTKSNLQRWASEIATTEGTRVSSGNLVDVARQWVEKQGLLPSSEELPSTDSFPRSSGLLAAAKEARYDKESVIKFFRVLIRRRYFSDELPSSSPWSMSPLPNSTHRTGESSSDEDQFHRRVSLSSEGYKYNVVPPLPAQLNLTPPPTLYPQLPMSASENYSFHRFSPSVSPEIGSTKPNRADINV
ncbi:small GTPase LIP1-like isoform X2 [Musa acuminata AAA Group]|uniref:small GTPase LIP1 isoform X2 n=1 Tax=Musa acuminata AAA Group TaxID=214697 RepID=UPI0031CFE3E5